MSTKPAGPRRYRAALPGVTVVRRGEPFDPADIDYIFVWKPKPDAFDGLSNLKAVLSLGAGVDALLQASRTAAVPIVRFVDADLTPADERLCGGPGHHAPAPLYALQARPEGAALDAALSAGGRARPHVGIMGLGVLGRTPRSKLQRLGFTRCSAGAGRPRPSRASGPLRATSSTRFLGRTDILVLPAAADAGHHGHPQLRAVPQAAARGSMADR